MVVLSQLEGPAHRAQEWQSIYPVGLGNPPLGEMLRTKSTPHMGTAAEGSSNRDQDTSSKRGFFPIVTLVTVPLCVNTHKHMCLYI